MNARYVVNRLIGLVREEALKNGYSKITGIHIRLGAQENIGEKDLLKTFNEAKNNFLIKDACLVIKKSKALARCRYCGHIFEVFYFKNKCKQCGSAYLEFVTDRGISLEKVEGE